jgi:endonuclease-3
MATRSRSAQFAHVHKVLKRHYKPVQPSAGRAVLEYLLFACCLENAYYDVAEEAFAALVEEYFDWNEIRVSTVRELAEMMARLPNPPAAASRIKRVLQDVFESKYSFDLEDLRKKNLGPAIEKLRKIDGVTNFAVGYVVQSTLGGHAIPVDSGVLRTMRIVELISDENLEVGVIPGLERAITKKKGIEFGSLLHQLGADLTDNPYAPALREILLEIEPRAKARLPRRHRRKRPEPAESPDKPEEGEGKPGKDDPAKAEMETTTGKRKKQPADPKKKPALPKTKPKAQKVPAKKKPPDTKKKAATSKAKSRPGSATKKSATTGLSKRKPR